MAKGFQMSPSWDILFVDDDRDFLDAKPHSSAAADTPYTRPKTVRSPGLPPNATPDIIFIGSDDGAL
jgi:hypothetical protein